MINENQTQRYFSEFQCSVPLPSEEELLNNPESLSSENLLRFLTEARDFLISHPGPNFDRRRAIVPEWFGFWHNLVNNRHNLQKPLFAEFRRDHSAITPFDSVAELVDVIQTKIPVGVLNAAGFEGHKGHLFALQHIARTAKCAPLIMFEPNTNFERLGKVRKRPFLPLTIRLAMWSLHPDVGAITLAPEYPFDTNLDAQFLSSWYQEIFDQTNARYSFAYVFDPNRDEKINRGQQHAQAVIPFLPTPSTTQLVQSLMPDMLAFDEADNIANELQSILAAQQQRGVSPEYLLTFYEPDASFWV